MKILILLALIAVVSAEVIDIQKCAGVAEDKCTIHQIRISPCPNKRACRLVKGEDATTSFDYTPHFSATKLVNTVTWNNLPWESIDSDACKYTTCPVEEGKQYTYTANMHIGKKLPDGKYTFKWEVHDESNVENQCCFMATVQLKKPKN